MSAHDRQHPLGALRQFLQARRQDAPEVDGLVIALSGGSDSLALLLAAAQIAPVLGYRLRALHVHHGLHADADAWAARAVQQATAAGLSCDVLRVRVAAQASLEAAARQSRYDALAAALSKGEALLLAHHRDDQAETVLLRLMRGAGLHGLAAMRAVSSWRTADDHEVPRWRPWLDLPRVVLSEWRPRAVACLRSHEPDIRASALVPITDPANTDARFDRTLLRHELMPLLARRWPEAAGQLARCAGQLAAQATALDAFADDALQRAGYRSDDLGPLALPVLAALDDAALQVVIARWLARRGAPPLPVRYWTRLRRELLQARADAQPRLTWMGWSLRRYRAGMYLLVDQDWVALPPNAVTWPDPRQVLCWAGREWRAEQLLCDLSRDDPRLQQSWRLQPRQGGERWQPPGRPHSVSVKQWCQERGVPPWVRKRLVCVWIGDEIVAIQQV